MNRTIFIVIFCFLMPISSYAADTSESALYLYKETFDGTGISRFYKSDDGTYYNTIVLPEPILEKVQRSDNPLLESKKLLALSYYQAGANERLTELFSQFDPQNVHAVWGIDENYKKEYKNQTYEVIEYVKINKEKKLKFDLSNKEFQNYTEFVPKEFEALHKTDFTSSDDLLDSLEKPLSAKIFSADNLYIFGLGFLIILLGTVSYLIFKRR